MTKGIKVVHVLVYVLVQYNTMHTHPLTTQMMMIRGGVGERDRNSNQSRKELLGGLEKLLFNYERVKKKKGVLCWLNNHCSRPLKK